MTFDEYLKNFSKNNGNPLSDLTIERYSGFINSYKEHFNVKMIHIINFMNGEIKRTDNALLRACFLHYLRFLGAEISKETNRIIINNSEFFMLNSVKKNKSALNNEHVLFSKVLSKAELKRLYFSTKSLELRYFISMLYDTAGRRFELCNAKFCDLTIMKEHNIAGMLSITRKGSYHGEVYLTKKTMKLLKEYKKRKGLLDTDYLMDIRKRNGDLFKDRGQILTDRIIKPYAIKTLGKKVTAHYFRHTKATHLADNGADVYSIMKYLGHRDIKTTLIYIKFSSFRGKRAFIKYSEDVF